MNTITKEDVLAFLISHKTTNVKKRTLEEHFHITHAEREILHKTLRELEREKLIQITNKGRIVFRHKDDLVIGKFYHNPRGYGFLVSISDNKNVYFIPPHAIHHALHEDVVVARKVEPSGKREEAEIQSILQRTIDMVTGTYIATDNFGFVIPDNQKFNMDIYIPYGSTNGANSYDKVVCKIKKFPARDKKPEGEIVEVLGFEYERGVDIASVIRDYNLRNEFPEKVLNQCEKIDQPTTFEFENRRDLRDTIIFTIDGEDSKDLDDAVSIRRLENGHYELGVHIADVSHYVKEHSKLDKEALERGVSVYLVDTVLPMLPEKLSNDLCSLNPNTNKLTLSVLMEIDPNGGVVHHDIFESVICSRAKLNYREVSMFLNGENPMFQIAHPELTDPLRTMQELMFILMEKRKRRGNIDFDFPEAKIHLNEEGKVIDIVKYDRGVANQIIEEFMIICNETVAEDFFNKQIPFVFRTHDSPREEKMQVFQDYIQLLGYSLEIKDVVTPKQLQDILHGVKGKHEEQSIHLLLLRCMQQARYTSICKGHFGLATTFYTHFTSPIRRYPDLQIHRIIKEYLHGAITDNRIDELSQILDENTKLCSKRERIAERAEDALHTMKKLEFMRDKVGLVFDGVVTNLINSGFSVTLDNTVEGIVNIHTLQSDQYELKKEEHAFVGKQTSHHITLGDRVSVVVDKVKSEEKIILLTLAKLASVENRRDEIETVSSQAEDPEAISVS